MYGREWQRWLDEKQWMQWWTSKAWLPLRLLYPLQIGLVIAKEADVMASGMHRTLLEKVLPFM